jgi:hypothetical protein
MSDPITKVVSESTGGHFTLSHVIIAMVIAGFTGGFFNPLWNIVKTWWHKRNKNHIVEGQAKIEVAKIIKEEKTEGKLWERVENLEKKINEEIDKRLKSEKVQGDLQRQVDELKRERLFTLSRYIHLKLRVEEAKKEIEYLKSKLREKDPEFDKDYPNFRVSTEALEDERLIEEIIQDIPSTPSEIKESVSNA